ncbi:hypothetical protein ACSVC9_01340 [Clostridium sp. LBM24168]
MKKINILLIILTSILILIVYKNVNLSLNSPINLRKTINLPIEGTWTASRYVFVGDSPISRYDAENMINKKAIFNGEEVKFNNLICNKPNFKVKIVDSRSYFDSNLKIDPEDLGVNQKQIKVVTVFSHNNFFDDFVQISDNLMIRYSEGLVLFFTKDGSAPNKAILNNIDKKDYKTVSSRKHRDSISKSGLLLGLKSRNEAEGGYDYRTLWISSSYGEINKILQKKNILVPRKNGFWEVGVNKKYENGSERDVVWGVPIIKNNSEIYKSFPVIRNIKNTNSQILFIGTEFISLDNEEAENRYFSVLPMDNLNGKKVEFSKVLDKNANDRMKLSAEIYLGKISRKKYNVNFNNLSTNWALARRSGRWILRGRISYGDFDIIYPATSRLLTSYDDLYPSFDVIKRSIPDAVDAYTSPNRDFIVVMTADELRVYDLKDNRFIGKPKSTLRLRNGEKAVMSQWSMGSYVDDWNKLFKDNK